MAQKYLVRLDDGADASFELRREAGRIEVRRENEESWRVCELSRVGDTELYVLMIDNRPTELYLQRRRGGAVVTIGRHTFNFCIAGMKNFPRAFNMPMNAAARHTSSM